MKIHLVEFVQLPIMQSAIYQSLVAFHANNGIGFSSQRQSEVTHAAEQIQHAVIWLQIKQFNGPPN